MQSTSIVPWHTSYYYPVPKRLLSHLHNRTRSKSLQLSRAQNCLAVSTTRSCDKGQENHQNRYPEARKESDNDVISPSFSEDCAPSSQASKYRSRKGREEPKIVLDDCSEISSNMLWADVKAAVGQRINIEGIVSSCGIIFREQHMVIPHASVADVRYIDWAELKRQGFQGVVFDKDNTITVPYSLRLWAPLRSSLHQCKSLFGDNIAVFSNSAGLSEFDTDGRRAKILEDSIGIKVIRHRVKKPAGSAEEIERHFGCESSRLIMVGDRPFTDIVYGNRNGFFTVLTEPLSLAEDPWIVRQVRKLEVALVRHWSRKGLKPISHKLVEDPIKCVRDVPL